MVARSWIGWVALLMMPELAAAAAHPQVPVADSDRLQRLQLRATILAF